MELLVKFCFLPYPVSHKFPLSRKNGKDQVFLGSHQRKLEDNDDNLVTMLRLSRPTSAESFDDQLEWANLLDRNSVENQKQAHLFFGKPHFLEEDSGKLSFFRV